MSLKLNLCEHDVLFINVYGPNNDDASFYETPYEFFGQTEENEFHIGGDSNTVLDPVVDKFGVYLVFIKNCREKINSMLDSFDLVDIWRVYHPTERHFT